MAEAQGSTPSIRISNPETIGPRDPYNRVPPQDIEAEQSLLGSMLLERDAIHAVLPLIGRDEADRFYRPDHRKLYEIIVDVYDRNEPIDLVTMRSELRRRGLLEEIGGEEYLITLAESVPSGLHAEYYAKIVRDKAMLREIITASGKIAEIAYSHSDDANEIIDLAEHTLFKVTDRRTTDQAEPIRESLEQIFRQLETRDGNYITGVSTGFVELDEMLSGLQPGEMIIIAARPSMGKTAFGLNMAEHIAINEGKPVVFFSMEMSKQAITQRVLCSRGRVDSHRFRRGMLSDDEIGQLRIIGDDLQHAPLLVDDTPGMSSLELRAKARRLKMKHDIQAVFIDYIQLMRVPGRVESRQQEVAEISRGLKALGRELNVPIVVLAQLNRNPEGRTDGRPRMSDLRESGAIEQDADVIMLLHREEYYKKDNTPEELKGVAEVIIDKQRNGPTGTVKLHFSQRHTRFENLSLSRVPSYVPSRGAEVSGYGSVDGDYPPSGGSFELRQPPDEDEPAPF